MGNTNAKTRNPRETPAKPGEISAKPGETAVNPLRKCETSPLHLGIQGAHPVRA